ncbi:MAG: dihydrolipoyl dehydrogenase [Theionarchaea archaeon]|nr:dihydrolipoyl dehydrogenase [Theionarchaea archaeon]MBU6999234.1 dihydrolipoyl dehydrogenase [Theionarchaea archaeon]MBU7019641.1 dihydrolipoyl dehydrogenase [Theionarchaea archaeon]
MEEYDVIVIGSGSGAIIASRALSSGLKVALVDRGPLGGTCLNVGCIPSKMLIYPADVLAEIQEAKKLGITAEITSIDFTSIMERMKKIVHEDQNHMRAGIEAAEPLGFFETEAHFTDDYTLDVGGKSIEGKKIFIVSGARPLIPPVQGLDTVDYLTNESVLQLTTLPESMIIIGGGYIAAEYGHFFASMGTEVTILQRGDRLLANEEPEISDLLKQEMSKRMRIEVNTEAFEVKKDKEYMVTGKSVRTGKETTYSAEQLLVAAGRKSNADLLRVENTGVETDKRGYIRVNEYLETSKKNIWALGDAIGKEMFRHVANREADIAWHNSAHEKKVTMDYSAVPHAVFSHPQIASVGLTEEQAEKTHAILVGKAMYTDVAKGMAMMEDRGFAKAIVEKDTWKILGFHIVGPFAPILIQEVVDAMAAGGSMMFVGQGMHIHPALPELVVTALSSLKEPGT